MAESVKRALEPLAFEVHLGDSYFPAVERVTAALKAEGFGVLTRIDVHTTLKEKLGQEFRPYSILGACNPQLAHRALSHRAEAGLLLPCNVTVEGGPGGARSGSATRMLFSRWGVSPRTSSCTRWRARHGNGLSGWRGRYADPINRRPRTQRPSGSEIGSGCHRDHPVRLRISSVRSPSCTTSPC